MTLYPWQTEAWQALNTSFHQLPNAWLFHGQRGIGKVAFAKAVAAALLCQQPNEDKNACRHCQSCHWLDIGHHPDFYELTPSTAELEESAHSSSTKASVKKLPVIKVEAITRLAHFATLSSHQGALRIALIAPAEAITLSAANALLKMLEEPPPTLLFLLVTHHLARLLPTLRSRCRPFLLPPPTYEAALAWLRTQSFDQPEKWLALEGGSPLLTDTASYLPCHESCMATLKQPTMSAILALSELIEQQKIPLSLALEWLGKWLFDLAITLAGTPPRFYPHENTALKALAEKTYLPQLWLCYDKVIALQKGALQALNTRLQIEALLMDYRRLFRLSPN